MPGVQHKCDPLFVQVGVGMRIQDDAPHKIVSLVSGQQFILGDLPTALPHHINIQKMHKH